MRTSDSSRAIRSSRIPPPLWMFTFAVSMWALNRYYPVLAVIPEAWRGYAHTTFNPFRPEAAAALVTFGVFGLTRNPMQIRPEERALRLRFGTDYDRYCQGVNRWWGRNRGRRTGSR